MHDTDISERDDVPEGVLTPEERLPQVRDMLLVLAEHIRPGNPGIFSEAPKPDTPEQTLRDLEKIVRYLKTGEYR